MSGRGRGRGRGRGAPPSGAKLLLMRSAKEAGIDDTNLKSLSDITSPALFPDLIWNYQEQEEASRARQSSTVFLINKGREIDHRIQTSAHWIPPTNQNHVDVVRYHQKRKRGGHRAVDAAVLEQMGKKMARDTAYVPSELLPSGKRKNHLLSMMAGGDNVDESGGKPPALDELEQKEKQRKLEEKNRNNVLLQEEETEGNLSDEVNEDDDEVEDYTTNYYESDDESDGGGDGGENEAVF